MPFKMLNVPPSGARPSTKYPPLSIAGVNPVRVPPSAAAVAIAAVNYLPDFHPVSINSRPRPSPLPLGFPPPSPLPRARGGWVAAQSLRPPPPPAVPAPPRVPRPSAPAHMPPFCGRGGRGRGGGVGRRGRSVARPRPCGGCARLHPRRARRPSRPSRPRSPRHAPHRFPPRNAPRVPRALCRGGVGGAGAGSSRPRPPARAVSVCRVCAAAVGRVRQLEGGLGLSGSAQQNPWSNLVSTFASKSRIAGAPRGVLNPPRRRGLKEILLARSSRSAVGSSRAYRVFIKLLRLSGILSLGVEAGVEAHLAEVKDFSRARKNETRHTTPRVKAPHS